MDPALQSSRRTTVCARSCWADGGAHLGRSSGPRNASLCPSTGDAGTEDHSDPSRQAAKQAAASTVDRSLPITGETRGTGLKEAVRALRVLQASRGSDYARVHEEHWSLPRPGCAVRMQRRPYIFSFGREEVEQSWRQLYCRHERCSRATPLQSRRAHSYRLYAGLSEA